MIDPIGAPAGVLALTIFVFNITLALQQALKGMRNNLEEVAELNAELNDVQKALEFLRKAAAHNTDDLLQLEPLLHRCGEACQAFLKLITKCSSKTDGKRAAFVSWAKLKVAESDITRLRNVLNQVKSTTTLTLGGINLQRFTVNAATLDEYQGLVTTAMAETQQNLRQINSQLESFSIQHPRTNDQDFEKWQQLLADKIQCENDLHAFSEVLAHLQEVKLDKLDTILGNPAANQAIRTTLEKPTEERLSIANIQEFMEKVPQAIVDLKSHLCSIENELRPFPKVYWETRQTLQADKQADEHRLNVLRRCNDKADRKRTNVFKDVRAAERAHQAIVSNVGQLFDCDNVSAERGARQLLGQYSDESIQQFWSAGNTMSSSNGNLYQNDVSQKREWFAWQFVALWASSGVVAWIVNRGLA